MHLTVIKCTPQPGPSRFERRFGRPVGLCLGADVRRSPDTEHLGTFEGAHYDRRDEEESECLLKAFLSLFAIVAALSALAAFTWGL